MPETLITTALSSNAFTTNERPVDMYEPMLNAYPDLQPLTVILSRLAERETSQSVVRWEESREFPNKVMVGAVTAAAGTALDIPNFAYVRNHDILYNPENEARYLVQDAAIDQSVTVIDLTNGGGALALECKANTELHIISSGLVEALDEANPMGIVNVEDYNNTQEIDYFIRTSKRTMNEASFFGGKGTKRQENWMKLTRMAAIRKEKLLFMGKKYDANSGLSGYTSNKIKTMDGIFVKLRNGTNLMNVNGPLTETALDEFLLRRQENFPDGKRLLFITSLRLHNRICGMLKPNIRITPDTTSYGLKISEYFNGSMSMGILSHPLFTGPYLSGWGCLLDLDYIKLVYQQRPELTLDAGTKIPNFITDKYYECCSLILANEIRHSLMINAN